MICQDLERFLYPYLDGEFQAEERLEVEAHLSRCPACAQRVHTEAQMREALRRAARHAVQSSRAPEALRASIQLGVRREYRRTLQLRWMRASAAVLVVAAAGSAWVAVQPEPRQRFVDDAAKRHARTLPYEIAGTNHEGVERWFDGKLEHHVAVPRLPNAVVSGARISNVTDRTAAYISYESAPEAKDAPPRRIGLFVFDDSQRDVEAPPLAKVRVGSSNGYNVAMWRDGEIVYEMVTDLDESDIRRMLEHQGARRPAGARPPAPDVSVKPVSLP